MRGTSRTWHSTMSAEFCALCDATGLDTEFWAGRLRMPAAEIDRWSAPTGAPPRAVIDLLDTTLRWQHSKLELLESTARAGQRVHLLRFPDELDFIATYGPAIPWKAHEHLIAQAYARLRVLQLPAVLHDFNAAAFHQWLGAYPDTPSARAQWLAGLTDAEGALAQADQLIAEAFEGTTFPPAS